MINLKYVCPEEIRLMVLYEHNESERQGHSLGDDSHIEWIDKYAAIFRDWSNDLPDYCVNCGRGCQKDTTECVDPFNPHRVHLLKKDSTTQLY